MFLDFNVVLKDQSRIDSVLLISVYPVFSHRLAKQRCFRYLPLIFTFYPP
jgi:hypothetical protein